jgi:DUF4097 and DUF4098 domain-containing protein YvlB
MDYGNVEIESIRGNLVQIEMQRSVDVSDLAEAKDMLSRFHEYSFASRSNNVYIESRYDGKDKSWGNWGRSSRFKIRLVVQVPEQYNVDFETGAGNIEIDDLEGKVEGKTGAGNVVIGAVMGPVEVSSGAGNINIDGARGHVDITTGAGNIDLEDVMGIVRANTGAGNVTARITQQPDEDSRLESGAGNVTVYLDSRVGVYVDAVASMGSASCDYDLPVRGKWMKKSFEGEINGGGPDLYMRAGVGNVTLRRR